jgi:hypothetical protein
LTKHGKPSYEEKWQELHADMLSTSLVTCFLGRGLRTSKFG